VRYFMEFITGLLTPSLVIGSAEVTQPLTLLVVANNMDYGIRVASGIAGLDLPPT
jgi:hypothetical protein